MSYTFRYRPGLLFVLVVFVFGGCAIFPAREAFFYALEYEAPDDLPGPLSSSLGVIRVFEPGISTAYNRRQIVVRDGTPRFQYLTDDMWAVDLVDSLQYFVERYFIDAGTFEALVGEFSPVRADLELHAAIRRVEFYCCDDPEARVEVVFELRRPGGQVVLREQFRRNESLPENDLVAFARGVNDLFLEAVVLLDQRIRSERANL